MSGSAPSIELGESVLKLDADYKPTHYETAAVYKSLRRTLQGLRSPSLASYEHFIAVQDAITLQSCPKLHHGWVLSDVYLRHQTSQFTLPQQYRQIYKKYFDQHFFNKKFMDDKPKIMLTRNPVASVDSPTLVLETQLTRYSYVQFYRDMVAVDSNLRASLLRDTLLGLSGAISFPHSLCMELVVMTKDERILLAKRSPKVAYDPEKWSCSVAETFAVEDVTEGGPNSAIRHWIERALREELGLGTEDYDIANFRILSVFLESDIMNVSLCTLMRVDVDHETLTDIIIAKPRRDYEFTEHDYITFPEMMRELVNPQRKYDTTSRYKMLFSLIHQYGEASFIKHLLAEKREL